MNSSDLDEEDKELDEGFQVELGFVGEQEPVLDALLLHAEPDWTKWDSGKVGGRPSWLYPFAADLPSTTELQCQACRNPLSFLLQIYCPLDDVDDAFHRSLYVFVCRSSGCDCQGDGKAFRLQLPKENAFYAATGGATARRVKDVEARVGFCVLCGQRATLTCSACRVAQYCSKSHQKDHWVAGGHKYTCTQCLEMHSLVESDEAREKVMVKGSTYVFPEQVLEIDHEPDSREAANEYEAKMMAEFEDAKTQNDDDDTDLDVTQQELNEALGHTTDQDEQYVRFLTRVALAKDQVLRYSRWENEAVLWVHSKGMLTSDVPPCGRCGSARKFEFQVLPQLLHYLGVDKQSSLGDITSRSCEWGTLAVYTCAKSCPLETQCAQEFLHYQPAYAGTA